MRVTPHFTQELHTILNSYFFLTAVLQVYEARVNDEFVLRNNNAILKCIGPSFVADFIHVVAWIMDNDTITAESQTIDPGSFKIDTNVYSYRFLNPFYL